MGLRRLQLVARVANDVVVIENGNGRAIMNKVITALLAGAISLSMTAASEAAGQTLVGSWSRGAEGEPQMVFTFREDGTGSWWLNIPGDQGMTDTYEFRYSVDYDSDPNAVDISDIDHGPLMGQVLYGVVRFEEDGGLSLDFEMGPPGDDTPRPPDFSGNSVARLERVNDR